MDLFIDAFPTSVGTRSVFVLDKMPPRRCLANEGPAEEVYMRDHIIRLE